jgi:hypothetical protein
LAAIAQDPALGVQNGSGPEDSELMKPEFPVKRIFYYFADLLNPSLIVKPFWRIFQCKQALRFIEPVGWGDPIKTYLYHQGQPP